MLHPNRQPLQILAMKETGRGKALKHERLQALMGDGGIQECGFAQNCVEACPKDIPLTKAIADTGREVMKQAIKDFFRG
jgi:succinate dehydrogenase / fumarate reductase, iron-sulfur subunit